MVSMPRRLREPEECRLVWNRGNGKPLLVRKLYEKANAKGTVVKRAYGVVLKIVSDLASPAAKVLGCSSN